MYANVLFTHQVLRTFKKRFEEKGKRSAITFTSAMASLAPIPGLNSYAASKIFTDYVAWGLMGELKYVDVSAWRAAGVSTKIIGNPETNPMVASPETYVRQAFSKMTSGVHAGYFGHELMHLFWMNVNDVLPIKYCANSFHKMLKKMKEKEDRDAAAKKAS